MRDLAGRGDLRDEDATKLAAKLLQEQTAKAALAGADRLTEGLAIELRTFSQGAGRPVI